MQHKQEPGIKAVIFDWAGTMVDFGSCAPVEAMQSAFAEEGLFVDTEAVRRYMGMAKREHVIAMLSEPQLSKAWSIKKGADWSEADVDVLMARLEPAMKRFAEARATLIPGAAQVFKALQMRGVRVGSTTGYTKTMMESITDAAAQQGYTPEAVVYAGDTRLGRPTPMMIWNCLSKLGVWPTKHCVKVDDAPVGIEAGVNAGTWTVGLAGSGNEMGLSLDAYEALSEQDRTEKLHATAKAFETVNADFVIATVSDLPKIIISIEDLISQGRSPGEETRLVL